MAKQDNDVPSPELPHNSQSEVQNIQMQSAKRPAAKLAAVFALSMHVAFLSSSFTSSS
jgi:hypothetical protein